MGLRRALTRRPRGSAAFALFALAFSLFSPLLPASPVLSGDFWHDTAGQPIRIQRGCLIPVDDRVLWFGVEYERDRPGALKAYSTSDLSVWEPLGAVTLPENPASVRGWHDPVAKTHNLLVRVGPTLRHYASSSPAGPYEKREEAALPGAAGDGDFSLWIEENGDRLLAYTTDSSDSKTRDIHLAVWPKGSPEIRTVHQFAAVPFHLPCLWKRGRHYILTASSTAGRFTSPIHFTTSENLAGPWPPLVKVSAGVRGGSMMAQKGSMALGFDSKHNGVFRLPGAQGDLLVYSGDRWSELMGYGTGRHVLLPVEVVDGVPGISWLRPWFANLRDGTFTEQLKAHRLWR